MGETSRSPCVLFVTYNFPPVHAGPGKNLLRRLSWFSQYGLQGVVITAHRVADSPTAEVIANFHVMRIPLHYASTYQRLHSLWTVFWHTLRIARRCNVVHVIGLASTFSLGAALGGLFARRPLILETTGYGYDDLDTIAGRRSFSLWKYVFRRAERVVSISPAFTEPYVTFLGNFHRVTLIPISVDCALFSPRSSDNERRTLRQRLGLSAMSKVIVSVGGIVHHKGTDILLHAFRRAWERLPEAHLLLVGPYDKPGYDRAYYGELVRFVRSRGLSQAVTFIGGVSNVISYLRASDMFVLPSRREGLPSALLEAMAVGLPVVVANIPGVSDFVVEPDINGFVFSQGDVAQAASYLLQLARNPILAHSMGKKARATVVGRFCDDSVLPQYLDMYTEK